MSFIGAAILGSAAIGAGASIYGAYTQSKASQQAAQTLANQQGMALSTAMHALQPYSAAGQSVLPTLKSLITPGPNQTATLSQTPGFQFAQDWGLKGVQNVQSTRGLGGNALAAGSEFSTGLAQQTWQNVVQNLMNLYRTGGQAAGSLAGTTANISGSFGPAIASTEIGSANALAGGAAGVAGAAGGATQNLLNLALLNKFGGGGAFATPPPPTPNNSSTAVGL